ncbi:LacI family DNA-binding transcriptional regulator [Streptomyces sp. NPDC101152]|uniref:LacI family DNA-binding transcriptional regulator n=1 Tax=Streptomyces sp. NPDC101152 TaxID=3366116 RepID=UPI0038116E64
MADVAEKAGVSRALVSIVFRNQPGASEETRERVLRVADEIGYRPDSAARLLARGRSRTLGVMFTVQQTFHTNLIEGIYPEAERLGYEVLLSGATRGRSEEKAVEALLSHRCEAVILLGSFAEPAFLDQLGRRTVAVSVSRRVPHAQVDFVHSAEGKGVRQAMDHLVELGHRRIVHIDGGRGPGSAERRRAYRAAMRRHGLEAEERVLPGDHTEESGIETGRLLLAERDRGRPLPTAVLAGNDRCAMGLLMPLTRAGVEVPRDLSVVGYDDSHLSHLMPIGLTTVRQDAVLMAEHAVRFAVERLEDPQREPREAVVDPELVVRGTSGPPPADRADGAGAA